MNFFKRWYDTDAVVSKVIRTLEKSDEDVQILCAEYVINLLKGINLIEMSLDDQYNYIMRRWYDKNVKVSHAIEYLRRCPLEIRREMALKVEKYLKELKKSK